MKLSEGQYYTLFFATISFILLYIVFKMIDYIVSQNYVVECFTNGPVQESTGPETSHTVNLPLNTTYSCKNFCGPTSRCAITSQQCFTDIDCPGCQPNSSSSSKNNTSCIPGDNDSGKLTVGVTPDYSPLTGGYGTKERIITDDLYAQPPQPNFGVDVWGESFNQGQALFNKRYKPNQLQYMPNYPPQYSITGEFIGDGPLPSNY
jgi:hypothetical protein